MGTKFRTAKIFLPVCLIICMLTFCLFTANAEPTVNLLINGDFENLAADNKADVWGIDSWQGDSSAGITDQKTHSGKYAAFIQLDKDNDTRLVQTVPVESNTVYRFTGWIATQSVTQGKLGANLCVMGEYVHSAGVQGDSVWQPQELVFRTYEGQTEVTLGARLGFWGGPVKGTAFFDDLVLQKVTDPTVTFQQLTIDSKPAAPSSPLERPGIAQPKPPEPANIVTGVFKYLGYPTWIIVFYLLLLAGISLRPKELDGSLLGETKYKVFTNQLSLIFFTAAAINFVIRIPLFGAAPISNDIGSYKAWIFRMMDLGPGKFYANGYTCDYPPFPMYFLWLTGGIAKLLKITGHEFLFNSLIKLPALICDIATAWVIFTLLKKKRPLLSLLLSISYMFLPAVVYLSSFWGQIDTYYAFLMILSFYFIAKKKPEIAVIFVVASFLTKTQTLAFIPLLLFYLFYKYDWKRSLGVIGIAVGAAILILLPYTIGNPLSWIIDFYKYQGTIYHYATLNAANFLVLLNGNYTDVSTKVFMGLNYYIVGILLFLAAVIWICRFYLRKKTEGSLAASFFMIAFAFFMFFPLMHERYLYPALAFLFLTIGYYKDKKLFFGAILLSFSYLMNLHVVVLRLQNLMEDGNFNRVMYILSLINTGLFVYFLSIFQMQLQGDSRRVKKFITGYTGKLGISLAGKLKTKPFKLVKKDYIALGIIVLVYSLFLFFRIGSWNTPRTGYDFPDPGSAIEVVLENPSNINTIVIYDAEGTGQLQVEQFANGVWSQNTALKCDKYYVLDRIPFVAQGVERLRFIPQPSAGHVNELAFLDAGNILIPVKSVINLANNLEEPAAGFPLFDEQQKMTVNPSYLNSTYFDEVYHGRTAYEYIQGSTVYETTHPPLGKDILALGILIFGMDPFGMRFMHVIMGILLMIVMFFLGRQVLATRFGAYAAMLLGMLDFMPFVQSRYATIDTTSVVFIALTFLFVFKYAREQEESGGLKRSTGTVALILFCFALASAVKWTGVYSIAGIGGCVIIIKVRQFLIYRRERGGIIAKFRTKNNTKEKKIAFSEKLKKELQTLADRFWKKNFWPAVVVFLVLFILIAPLTYYLSYIPYLNTKGIGMDQTFSGDALHEVLASQRDMYTYHSRLKATHPFTSAWWSWPFDFKPLWIYPESDRSTPVGPGNKVTIASMGNPVIWYLGIIAVFMLLFHLLKNRRFSIIYLVMAAFLSEYLPWVLVSRIAFIYHFYACLPFFLIFVAFMLEPFWESGNTGRKAVITIGAVCLLLLIMFYPILSGLEVSQRYVDFLKWFPKDWVF